ncbi:hypothetical protein B5M09_000988 [Aphanomyces astaci]|uniref:HTH CENPB-type domain-containing protein n=1 Tax=Aphanomyces astaci TaxID=112090 RepID=A0A3R7ZDA1_APHAT|nr:hypothetical protein B5M09_000988 [Aphanomyces astaci]
MAAFSKIPYNTLMKYVRATKAGTTMTPKRRGRRPTMPTSCEEDLVAWIGGMQRDGHPPERYAILVKANQLARMIDPSLSLTSGWYHRFRNRHPQLTKRCAQVISHARNHVDLDGVQRLYESLSATILEHALTPDRIFNMDETAFISRKKSNAVIALKGSQNRFNLFKGGGVPKSYLQANWLERRFVIRSEILRLPSQTKTKKSTRKTIDVGGRVLTLALLWELDKTKKDRQEAKSRMDAMVAERKKKRGAALVVSAVVSRWARVAATMDLKPLPNGQVKANRKNAVEVVV